MRFSSLLAPLPLLLLCPQVYASTQGAAVVDDGYAGKVLQKILPHVNVPSGQRLEARVSLDGDGNYLRCTPVKGNAQGICNAAKRIGAFGDPPYGAPTDILVAMQDVKAGAVHETNKQDAAHVVSTPSSSGKEAHTPALSKGQAAYMGRIRRSLRNSIYIPKETKPGTYHAMVRIKCDSHGKIVERAIAKSSGDSRLDRYVLQGIDRAGSVEAPPEGLGPNLDVNFTLVR